MLKVFWFCEALVKSDHTVAHSSWEFWPCAGFVGVPHHVDRSLALLVSDYSFCLWSAWRRPAGAAQKHKTSR